MRPGTLVFFLASVLLFICSRTRAQESGSKYDVIWKKIAALSQQKGLTRSAIKEVDQLYVMAKKENQQAQVIKALIYRITLGAQLEENDTDSSVSRLQKEIQTSPEPARSILYSLLAEKYLGYFQQHRWQLYGRTPILDNTAGEFAGWSVTDFHKHISNAYLSSIKNKKLLQATGIAPFEAIVIKGNARYLRPTLYDLVAHRALDYFSGDETDINKPAYAFEVRDQQLFAPARDFINLGLVTNDSLSLHHKALSVLQELLRFHINDTKPDALIDADIRRMQVVYQYGVMDNKDSLYARALRDITDRYPAEPAASQAWWMLAQWHAGKAASYDPLGDTTNRYGYLKAVEICEKVILQKQESEGRTNCLYLLAQIRRQELNMQTEKVNVPALPFRTLVSFRNVGRLFLRIVPLTDELKQELANRYDDIYWKQLTTLKPSRSWQQALPATKDFQRHSAEIKIDPLPTGIYLLLASEDETFSPGKKVLAAQYFHVSNISFISNRNDYFVLNRSSGLPLHKAAAQLWNVRYDYNNRKNALSRGEKFVTDQNGFFKIGPVKKPEGNIRVEINYQDDHLFLDDNPYDIYRPVDVQTGIAPDEASFEKKNAAVFFFTDRSIYRPGQHVYFKGIAITKDFRTRQTKVFANFKTVVKLIDANGQPVDSLELTTNDFGSYSGNFRLPENRLNGEFRLADSQLNGETNFSVEAYKRPKFFVEYEKPTGIYQLKDSLKLTVSARAYAGNNINGATIKYRVVREPRFIYPWLYWRKGLPRGERMEIVNGVSVTDANGNFVIRFKAVPDFTIDTSLNPVFDYRVIADVTDINGETRSAETMISVSYQSIQLQLGFSQGESLSPDSLRNIRILTTNLSGEFQPVLVHVALYRLRTPERLIRSRHWSQPDQFVMSREDYLASFPLDEYKDENEYRNWPKQNKVFERSDSTKAASAFGLPAGNIEDGWYLIEATATGKSGGQVKDLRYVQVSNDKNKNLPGLMYFTGTASPIINEPGTTARFSVGSSAADVFVVQQVDRIINDSLQGIVPLSNEKPSNATYSFHKLSKEKKVFEFPVTESDRGGFGVYHLFVKDNRFYQLSNQVLVPWTNKDLAVSYETFRDKTLPGSEEKWKIKIIGDKKERVAASLLVSMYDASLDQFRQHSWNLPAIWPTYNQVNTWNGLNNFVAVQTQEKAANEENILPFPKEYDRIIPIANERPLYIRGRESMSDVAVSAQMAPAPSNARIAGGKRAASLQKEEESSTPEYKSQGNQEPSIQVRKNFDETAFFLPELKTDSSGNVEFGFTIPEALTRWKFQALAYTKEAAFGYSTKDIITQKQLMVQPNAPRFLREGDHLELSTKVANLTAREITGTVQLELFDAANMLPVDGWFQNRTANQYFTAEAGQSVNANFAIEVPYLFNSAVVYRFTARTAVQSGKDSIASKGGAQQSVTVQLSDAEEYAIPVLTNRMLVTESLPFQIKGNGTRTYKIDKLLQSGTSETLQQHALTVEFTANPAWYVVQSLPYLMETTNEGSEQSFNRFYANALATKIANSTPRLKAIFEQWKKLPGSAAGNAETPDSAGNRLLSALEKNPELKAALLQETPWVLASKNEATQKKNIALLFDAARMSQDIESSLDQLKQFQSPNGGFVWFKGGPDDRFMTQYMLTGIGRLKLLGALPVSMNEKLDQMISSALAYLDQRIKEDYQGLLNRKTKLNQNNTGYLQIQFAYMRSFFADHPIPGGSFNAIHYYRKQAQLYWLGQNKMMQGMIALALDRTGDHKTAGDIVRSLEQNAIVNEELGMYWKDNRPGYYWYQAPIETQSLLIETFSQVKKDNKTTDALKTWLLKQKQTSHWAGTKSTADACYALLMTGSDWLNSEPSIEIKLGDKIAKSNETAAEAGTGYFSKKFEGPFVNPSMGNISVDVKTSAGTSAPQSDDGKNMPLWGAVHWQYFENLNSITSSTTALKLVKKIFVERNSPSGPLLHPVGESDELHVGDKLKVRIELAADRDMEYVHMKDMRAACLEPVNVLSSFKWQGGLGYYETTGDISTSFFFHLLPKGNYVFEYALFVSHTGQFSNGITSIQSLYAPEFSSHSEGTKIRVEE